MQFQCMLKQNHLQIAAKQKRLQDELEEKRRLGQACLEEARMAKQLEKDAKAAQKIAKAKELQYLKEQFFEKQRLRYDSLLLCRVVSHVQANSDGCLLYTSPSPRD